MEPNVPAEEPRVLAADSWLETAIPADDYHRATHPRVDTSLWALLFSWITPLGITLGIMGIVRSSRGDKNIWGIIFGSLAIVMSLVLPVILYFIIANVKGLEVGVTDTSPLGFTVAVPKDARLLNNSYSRFEYRLATDNTALDYRYGVTEVDVQKNAPDASSKSIMQALQDSDNSSYDYWVYQLLEASGRSVKEVLAVDQYDSALEVAVGYADGTYGVEALHFDKPNTIFVQYLDDGGSLASELAVSSVFGDVFTATDESAGTDKVVGLAAWRALIKSFHYREAQEDTRW